MKTFQTFIREASTDKPWAFLQLPPNETLQPGYAPVEAFLGPAAPPDICKLAAATWDEVKNDDLSLIPAEHIVAHSIRPTQSSLKVTDVEQFSTASGIISPIVVMRYNGTLYVLDGHHRLAAVRNLQHNTIPARVIER